MKLMDMVKKKAKAQLRTIVMTDDHDTAFEAAKLAKKEKLAKVIIVTEKNVKGVETINPITYEKSEEMAQQLFELRKNKGMTIEEARELVKDQVYFGLMMLKMGLVDGEIGGTMHNTAEHMGPAFRVIGKKKDVLTVSGILILIYKGKAWILSDTDFNIMPNAEELAQIAINAADFAEVIGIEPRVAMLSHSTKGSSKHECVDKVIKATQIVKEKMPDLIIDGELQLDSAINPRVAAIKCPDSPVEGNANVLIFPDLPSSNLACKFADEIAELSGKKMEMIGSLAWGMAQPVVNGGKGFNARQIADIIAFCAMQANR